MDGWTDIACILCDKHNVEMELAWLNKMYWKY